MHALRTFAPAAFALFTLGCSDDADGTGGGGGAATTTGEVTATSSTTGTGGGGGLVWSACHGEYECTTVAAPIDHDDPASERIDLRVMRIPAKGERRGVLFVNQGGPGDPTVAWLARPDVYPALSLVLFPLAAEHFDFIAVDWRGVGESEQVQCDIAQADEAFRALPLHPSPGAERQAYAALFAQYQSSCSDGHNGALVAHMDTEDAARDMDLVRQALGEETISYLGISYGGYLGSVYASLFPDRVRAFVLDSPASPMPDLLTDLESWATRIEPYYASFFAACGADPACSFHGGEGEAAVALAYETLVSDLEANGGVAVGTRTLTRVDVGKAISGWVMSDDVMGLGSALHDLEVGDGAALLDVADGWFAGSGPELLDTQIIFCLDRSATSAGLDAFWDHLVSLEASAAPHVAFDISNYWGICRDWPVTRPAPAIAAPSAPPLLVLAGNTDVWAPRPYAEATVEALANGSHLVIGDRPGHGQSTFATTSMCGPNAVDAFIDDPTQAPAVTDCNAN